MEVKIKKELAVKSLKFAKDLILEEMWATSPIELSKDSATINLYLDTFNCNIKIKNYSDLKL